MKNKPKNRKISGRKKLRVYKAWNGIIKKSGMGYGKL